MSSNTEIPRRYFEDILILTNCILGLGATCHMTPDISDFIPVSLVETYKYINVADGYSFAAKQIGSVQIKMHDINGKPFISTLYNVLLAPDLCNRLFFIITLVNSVHICLFHKRFCMFLFSDN